MKTIFRYQLEIVDHQIIRVPIGESGKVLGVAEQGGKLCMWFEVDSEWGEHNVEVIIVGTGNPLPCEKMDYVGTVVMNPFVWHVYISIN